MTRKIDQAQVRWTGTYTRCADGRLHQTTSSFQTTQSMSGVQAFNLLRPRENWLPHDGLDRRNGDGGWRLQHVEAAPVMVKVCAYCTQTCCNGRCSF